MEKVIGKLKYISEKTGGAVLEAQPDKWFNPMTGYKIPKELIGKDITFTIESGKVVFVEEYRGKPAAPKDERNQVLIVREVAAKCASEITARSDENLDFFKRTASEIEAWILR